MTTKWRVWAVALTSTIIINPYGSLSTLLVKDNPWRLFRSDDPVLTSIRAHHFETKDCESWVSAFRENLGEMKPVELAPHNSSKDQNWSAWMPFEEHEVDAIQDCDDFPCAVKLDKAEVDAMKNLQKNDRVSKFESLVYARMSLYAQTETRKPYEFSGGITDPWGLLETRGLKTDLKRPSKIGFAARALDLKESHIRPIRQVLDRRIAVAKDGKQASVWTRDVYTDHYFDSWGEWSNIQCKPDKGYVEVVFAMSLELDMLKKNDLISSLGKGKMRDATREMSNRYIDQWFGELEKMANEKIKMKQDRKR